MATQPRPDDLRKDMRPPPVELDEAPDPVKLLGMTEEAPALPEMNIFPMEWRHETPKLMQIYDSARDPGWSPNKLPWETLKPEELTPDQRYAISYWFALLAVFDASGPAVFSRAVIHTYETHEEDPIRKAFFSVARDEMNHEEVCGRAINIVTPGGPVNHEIETPLGELARNNVQWLFHNGARYWNAYKNSLHKYPVPMLFTSFLFGEVASSTLFHGMYQETKIPVLKEAFRRIGQDEARHLGICLTVLQKVLPNMSADDKEMVTKQIRAGFVFLSGVLFEPPEDFWELPSTFKPTHRLLEDTAREAGLGILSLEQREANWKKAVLQMKGFIEPHGIEFPALPEIGVDGKTTAFDPNNLIPVF
jgi:rubrerythrin